MGSQTNDGAPASPPAPGTATVTGTEPCVQAEQALRESEERLRLAVDSTQLGTFDYYPRTQAVVASAFSRMHAGLPPDVPFDVPTFLRAVHPDDRELVIACVRKALRRAGDGRYSCEYRTVGLADGRERWISSWGRTFFDGNGAARIIGVTLDITDRKRNELHGAFLNDLHSALIQSREPGGLVRLALRGIAAHLGVDLASFGQRQPDGVTMLWEHEVRGVGPREADGSGAGFLADDVRRALASRLGFTVADVASDPRTVGQVERYSLEGVAAFAVEPVVTAEGLEAVLCLVSRTPRRWRPDETGVLRGLAGSLFSALERARAQEALRESERRHRELAEALDREREKLREANARLAEADRRKDEFIAVLSHELRNPLAPIRYALPLLEDEGLGERGRQAVAVVGRQLALLSRLVDDLLDVSRITCGKIALHRQPVTCASVLATAVEAASPCISAAGHSLRVAVPDEPIWLDVDPARIAQVVTNLLDNSAKYTPRGGEIRVEAAREGEWAVIRVGDDGIGIAPDALRAVFEMFRQAHSPLQAQGGLGIGLALGQRLVEMHGGTIEARSGGVGQGAEFVVRVPLGREPTRADADPPARVAARSRRLRVLVVDDNPDFVEMLAVVVAGLGHDVRKALDGEAAIAAALGCRPDVVLLDVGLPGMSGIEVARELRRREETAGACLVAVTGWGQPEDRARTREAGFDHHLTKPTEPDMLCRLLEAVAGAPSNRGDQVLAPPGLDG